MFEKLTRFETSDQTTPGTAYYRNTYDQVKAAVYAAAKEMGMEVKSHNNDHKEFLLKRNSVEVIVTAFSMTIMETAIDLVVMTPVLTSGKKIAEQFFSTMKKHAQPK
ncbi:MAG: hypothetical protein FWG67_04120 [Defluviitaleaceae bacterium]|nr:hypothetical protein [Defluviitaleaceae bacterium]